MSVYSYKPLRIEKSLFKKLFYSGRPEKKSVSGSSPSLQSLILLEQTRVQQNNGATVIFNSFNRIIPNVEAFT